MNWADLMNELDDTEIILRLLCRCLPLPEAADATQRLLDRYGSYPDALSAPLAELLEISSLGERGASLLKCVQSAAIRLAAVTLREAHTIDNATALADYLHAAMGRSRIEMFSVLFLDAKNHLLADEALSTGDASWVNVSLRDIAERAIRLGASALILVHNHPSGDPRPTEQDLRATRTIQHALQPLGIRVHDHVIVGRGRICSLRELDFFDDAATTGATIS